MYGKVVRRGSSKHFMQRIIEEMKDGSNQDQQKLVQSKKSFTCVDPTHFLHPFHRLIAAYFLDLRSEFLSLSFLQFFADAHFSCLQNFFCSDSICKDQSNYGLIYSYLTLHICFSILYHSSKRIFQPLRMFGSAFPFSNLHNW